jgi:hypothetical protein
VRPTVKYEAVYVAPPLPLWERIVLDYEVILTWERVTGRSI